MMTEMGKRAKTASHALAKSTTEQKNQALQLLAEFLIKQSDEILAANQLDIEEASGLDPAMIDRLILKGRLEGIANDVLSVAALPDPVGEIIQERVLPNGLTISKKRTPIGVLGIIYEARPNVTIDIAALSIKTGNCAILRGGSETIHTNKVLVKIIRHSLELAGMPPDAIQWIDSPDRSLVLELLKLHQYVDMIIPRGGAGLHQFCRENSTIPVITGGIGICHLYVDKSADLKKALPLIHNAKTQRPTVCNALDTLLVNREIAKEFIPEVLKTLDTVEFRLDPEAMKIAGKGKDAGPDDWDTEWLALILGIKVVNDLEDAIQHIQKHSSGHSDGILTEDKENARRFLNEVDSAAVYVNASTRFTDGGQFGLGAEAAVSTQKLHARGPMGLEELTSYKWIIQGNYHIRK